MLAINITMNKKEMDETTAMIEMQRSSCKNCGPLYKPEFINLLAGVGTSNGAEGHS